MDNMIQLIYDMIDHGETTDRIIEKIKEIYKREDYRKVMSLINQRTIERGHD